MSQIPVDYSDCQDFSAPPAGKYPVIISEYKVSDDPNGSGPAPKRIQWKFKIFNAANPNLNGRTINYMTSCTGGFAWKLKLLLSAANPDYDGGSPDPEQYLGKHLEIETVLPAGKHYLEVRKINPYFAPSTLSEAFGS